MMFGIIWLVTNWGGGENMNWEQIIVAFITSCIPAIFVYLGISKRTQSKINEIKLINSQSIETLKLTYDSKLRELEQTNILEIEKLKALYELQFKDKEKNVQLELMNSFFTGELDIDKLSNNIEKISKIQEKTDKLNQKKSLTQVVQKKHR